MLANRIRLLVTSAALFAATGCELSSAATAADESDPPYQNLDGGDNWPGDDSGDDGEAFDPSQLGQADEEDPGTTDGDAGWCTDIGWESYQVTGSCPGLPSSGAIVQDESCTLEIPGDLGAVIGESGSVDGPHVSTVHCSGLAETSDLPSVALACTVDEASCEVGLSGGTSGW